MWRWFRIGVAFLGACALGTLPSAVRACNREAHLAEGQAALAFAEQTLRTRRAQAGELPTESVPWTPATACCATHGRCLSTAATWSHPSWRRLEFALVGTHYFQYRLDVSGAGYELAARSDPQCNGQLIQLRRFVPR